MAVPVSDRLNLLHIIANVVTLQSTENPLGKEAIGLLGVAFGLQTGNPKVQESSAITTVRRIVCFGSMMG